MNVASLELCKELYELSEWTDTRDKYRADGTLQIGPYQGSPRGKETPAYGLGYLLRELPAKVQIYKGINYWTARYKDIRSRVKASPEDAACKLALELFKQGILKREMDV